MPPVPRGVSPRAARRRIEGSHSGAADDRATVAHIAREEGPSAQRIRRIIAETLASREIDPPAGFVQLDIAWLSER